jgi:putative SOS response-associated peptidase YedK
MSSCAGLWERREGEGNVHVSSTLPTAEANELPEPYHDRMPVTLRPEDYDLRLDAGVKVTEPLRPLLRPCSGDEMTAYAVSTLVNSPLYAGPRCVGPPYSILEA